MRVGPFLWALLMCAPVHAATLYVVPDPSREAEGTDKTLPSGQLCQVIAHAKDGDTVQLAEGTYVLSQPCVVSKRRISLLGGWRSDFSSRDVFMSIARLTGPGSLLRIEPSADDLLVEGVMFDGGTSAAYGASLCPDCLAGAYDAVRNPALVVAEQAGKVRFRAAVFANAPGGALQGTFRSHIAIESTSIVNTRPFAVRASGSCGYASPRCVDLQVRGSSILWTWRDNVADDAAGGSAIVAGAGVSVQMEKAVVAYSDRAAVELESDQHTEVRLQQLVTFDNKAGDVLQLAVAKSGAELSPSSRMERLAMPWDIDYLNRYLARGKDRFYGARVPQNRVFMLSPVGEGLKTPAGSRLTYEAAVAGNVQAAVPAVSPPVVQEEDKKKKPTKKPKKGKK